MNARVGPIVFRVQPYTVYTLSALYTLSARFIFFGFFGFVIPYHRNFKLNDGSGLGPSLGLCPRPRWGVSPNPPERPPAYEYGARSEMVLPASTVLRGVKHRKTFSY